MKALFTRTLDGLRPLDEAAEAVMRNIPIGQYAWVNITKPRNPYFHRKFFAMLRIILRNQTHYVSEKDILAVCKIHIGHCDVIKSSTLGTLHIPKSISFASMDDTAFGVFYDQACDWVLADVIPGLTRDHLDIEVENELAGFRG